MPSLSATSSAKVAPKFRYFPEVQPGRFKQLYVVRIREERPQDRAGSSDPNLACDNDPEELADILEVLYALAE
jgi:hypothetical protein